MQEFIKFSRTLKESLAVLIDAVYIQWIEIKLFCPLLKWLRILDIHKGFINRIIPFYAMHGVAKELSRFFQNIFVDFSDYALQTINSIFNSISCKNVKLNCLISVLVTLGFVFRWTINRVKLLILNPTITSLNF